MREIRRRRAPAAIAKTDSGEVNYHRPGGPARVDKISPLRGLKQRWTADAGVTLRSTRDAAIRDRATVDIQTVQRVFV